MIGRIDGKIVEKQAPFLLVDVHGVAYELEASMQTFCSLPGLGEQVTLYTHLAVREDAQTLYGFNTKQERDLFRLLLKISGVGAKLALAILSGMSVEQFCRCVYDNDTASFVRLPGVGKKTAQRLLIEVKDRLPHWQEQHQTSPLETGAGTDKKQEAISAMAALGYKSNEAQRLVNIVYQDGLSSEDIIRRALQTAMKTKETNDT